MVFGFGSKLPFFDEITAGNSRKIRDRVRAHDQSIKDTNDLGDTALHHAASNEPHGLTQCLEALLDAPGIALDAQNQAGWTALHGAAINGRPQAVRLLILSGAKHDIQERTGQTPLHCAAHGGCVESLAAAVECGVAVDVMNAQGETPLCVAAALGDLACVKALLVAGDKPTQPPPNTNAVNAGGRSPLHSAAALGNLEMVEALLAKGADLYLADGEGQMPHELAKAAGHKVCAQRLTPKVQRPPSGALAAQAMAGMNPEASAPAEEEGLVAASGAARDAIQALFDSGNAMAEMVGGRRLQIVQVLQNKRISNGVPHERRDERDEESDFWRGYSEKRDEISLHYVKKLTDMRTKDMAPAALGLEPLRADVNEFLLFYGTTPKQAKILCASNLQSEVDEPRDDADAPPKPYGPGLYFHEEPSRADERAFDDQAGIYKGIYAMLLCRVAVGHGVQTSDMWPDVEELTRELTSDSVHSITGTRDDAGGRFREFVVPEASQAYPSYVVVYRRSAA